jgi:hypothetical protein
MNKFIAFLLLSIILVSAKNKENTFNTSAPHLTGPDIKKEISSQYAELQIQLAEKRDWFNRIADQTFNQNALILPDDRDPLDVILRRTKALLTDLQRSETPGLDNLKNELNALANKAGNMPVEETYKREDLFAVVSKLKRKIAFANPLLDFDKILFTVSNSSAGDFHMCDQYYGIYARPGGSIYVLDKPFSDNPEANDLFVNSKVVNGRLEGRKLSGGMFLFPELSYDGKKILFSYSECGRDTDKPTPHKMRTGDWSKESSFHVFSVNADGSGLSQLTDGEWNDVHPCWMPNGQIAFISERRGGFLRCSGQRPCPNYTLHAMNDDGSEIIRLSHHETNEWHPSVNNDGMILYTRWDYVDRGDDQAHHPWITTPDGRDPRAIQGNYKFRHQDAPDMEVYVRPIPGSHKYVSLGAPHHGGSYGSLIIIDPREHDDDAMSAVKRLTPEDGFPENRLTNPEEYETNKTFPRKRFTFEGAGERSMKLYSAAHALSENYYLTTRDKKLYLIDAFGNLELLFEVPGMYCLGSVPLKARKKPPVIPSQSKPFVLAEDYKYEKVGDDHPLVKYSGKEHDATVGVINVYNSLKPFPENSIIKELRIIQILQKTTPVHQKPWIGYGVETSARSVLGTVPVEKDGSAYFYCPPGKSVYFQALDEKGQAVQSMKSATYFQRGERNLCIGCHEKKQQSPNNQMQRQLAFKRKPSKIKAEPEGSNPFSFPLLVQPVLDKHCVSCHDGKKREGHAFDLTAGKWKKDKYKWYTSYYNLREYAWHAGVDQPAYDLWNVPRSTPGEVGAKASILLPLLENGHNNVKLSKKEMRRIVVWLDANSDFFGSYDYIDAQSAGMIVYPIME